MGGREMTVTPIMGEAFRFSVSSRSKPSAPPHTADWLRETCTCDGWSFRNRKHLAKHGRNYHCAHLLAAKDACFDEILTHTREQLLSR